jgi:hypothetical protein
VVSAEPGLGQTIDYSKSDGMYCSFVQAIFLFQAIFLSKNIAYGEK